MGEVGEVGFTVSRDDGISDVLSFGERKDPHPGRGPSPRVLLGSNSR